MRNVIIKVNKFWAMTKIPTMTTKSATRKLLRVYDNWQELQRSRKRPGATGEAARVTFTKEFDDIFDVALDNALSVITIQEDRDFLLA